MKLDPQARLVYNSEWASPSYENNIHFISDHDAVTCFQSIMMSKVWANKFKVDRELKLGFVDDRKWAGRYWPATTYLDNNAKLYYVPYGCVNLHNPGKNLHTLLHEMTHHIVNERFPKAEAHGPKFAWYLVAMVSCFFSKQAGAGLALSMKIHGVRANK